MKDNRVEIFNFSTIYDAYLDSYNQLVQHQRFAHVAKLYKDEIVILWHIKMKPVVEVKSKSWLSKLFGL